jgi:hypothetical protein
MMLYVLIMPDIELVFGLRVVLSQANMIVLHRIAGQLVSPLEAKFKALNEPSLDASSQVGSV